MTNRTRAARRANRQRAIERARRKLRQWGQHDADQKRVGKWANTACPCSCWMCGNPRRSMGERTLQEIKADISYKEELHHASH